MNFVLIFQSFPLVYAVANKTIESMAYMFIWLETWLVLALQYYYAE